jgi:hypothetical protein
VVEVIRERVSLFDARSRAYVEWQTKVLAGFIASTAQTEDGARKLHKAAEGLSMLPSDDTAPVEDPSKPAGPIPAEARVGSFEKLSGFFGGALAH